MALILAILLTGCAGLFIPPCDRQVCPDAGYLKVPNVFDNYTAATYKVLTAKEVKTILINDLKANGAMVPDDKSIILADDRYIGYREDIIVQARVAIPVMYDYERFLEKRVPGYDWLEASDCDNKAEWIAFWFHWMLPSSAPITIEGSNIDSTLIHRYVGVVTNDNRVIWFMSDPSHWRYNVCNILIY